MKKLFTIPFILFSLINAAYAQDDLLRLIPDNDSPEIVHGTFKSTRIISGQSIETTPAHHLDYRISHRFGTINTGIDQFYGLDQGYVYMGFDYGLSDRWMVGIGRSSVQKMVNLYTKYKLITQKTSGGSPLSVTVLGEAFADFLKYPESENRSATSKYSYASQLLIARKFSDKLSLQLMPTWVHRNRTNVIGEQNDVLAMGIAGRYKITKRTALIGEYYYVAPNQLASTYKNALSFGFDIETGGHVFSLHFTNSIGMVEKQFITETTDTWADGGVHFGFNLGRTFGLGKKYRNQYKVKN
jgi:hypothetical protein